MTAADEKLGPSGSSTLAAPANRARWRQYPIVPITILLSVMVIPALFADLLSPYDPTASPGGLTNRLQPPVWLDGSWDHLLGTDRAGRDVLSRMIHGARVSLFVALLGIGIGGLVGTVSGLVAGYFRGWIGAIIMRLTDMSLAFPSILLALVLVAAVGPGFHAVIIVISTILWAYYSRQIRAETLKIINQDFVARARVAGSSHLRIIVRHVFPNVVDTLLVLATLQVGFVILLEASLSFLGVGIPRPTPAWGVMVAEGRDYVVTAWWISFFPGMAILLSVLSLNLLGDWLRDRLDPRLVNL